MPNSALARLSTLALLGATLVAAPVASVASGSAPEQQQQTCPIAAGEDPDTVTLTGPSIIWPANKKYVSYTLTAAETPGEQGDGLPHGVTISYSVTTQDKGTGATTGASPASGNASGDFSVPIHFKLLADRAGSGHGRTYTITWSASFDGGPHTCSSSSTGNSPFVVVVPHDQRGPFLAQGIVTGINPSSRTVTVDDTDGDATLRGHNVSVNVPRSTKVQRDGASAALTAVQPGDRITINGTHDRAGHLQAAQLTAYSPPQPDAQSASVPADCVGYYGCTPSVPPATGGSVLNITISNYVFNPPVATIRPGTIVTVHNMDGFGHTFSANHLDSGTLYNGSSFSVEFTTPGTYRFFCAIHAFMNGVIDVTS